MHVQGAAAGLDEAEQASLSPIEDGTPSPVRWAAGRLAARAAAAPPAVAPSGAGSLPSPAGPHRSADVDRGPDLDLAPDVDLAPDLDLGPDVHLGPGLDPSEDGDRPGAWAPTGASWGWPSPWDWSPLVERVRADFGHVRLAERYRLTTDPVAGGTVQVVDHAPAVRLPALPPAADIRQALLSQLELVPGIGPATARRLRADGIGSVLALAEVARHRQAAEAVRAEWDADDLVAVSERLRSRLAGRGHLLATLLAGCVDPTKIAFVDVETLGLAGNAIFLCGVGTLGPDGLAVRQFLAPGYADEPAMLARALADVAGARVLVTYNGRTADVVWLRSRCFFHGLPPVPDAVHLDLVFGTRRRFVRDDAVLGDARLPTVQRRLLRMGRPSYDVPGAVVPELYQEYVRSGCEGLLVPVLDHNRSDLEALVLLLSRLCAEALAWCR